MAILRRVVGGISEDRIVATAAGVTFFVLLAIFPGIAGLISLYGLFADKAHIAQQLDSLAGVLPEGGMQILRDQINSLTSQPAQRLGLGTILGLAISLWSANGGVKAMFDALNVAYGEKEQRGFFKLNAISLAVTLGAIAFVIAGLVAITVVPLALSYVGLPSVTDVLIRIGRWPLMLVVAGLFITVVYRFGPCRRQPKWRWITPGSGFAALVWLAASLLFSWYAANFGSYNKTYGSLGAAIGFMTWIWISMIVVLVGAKLDAEIERQAKPPRASPTWRDSASGGMHGIPKGTHPAENPPAIGLSAGFALPDSRQSSGMERNNLLQASDSRPTRLQPARMVRPSVARGLSSVFCRLLLRLCRARVR